MRALLCLVLFSSACLASPEEGELRDLVVIAALSSEGFESGEKGSYAAGDVDLEEGSWRLTDALIGTLAADAKLGSRSARLRGTGKRTMLFDRAGAGTVTVRHARYGSDAPSTWQLYYSKNAGSTWIAAGAAQTAGSTLATASFALAQTGAIRLEIRKLDGGSSRINIDDIVVSDAGGEPPDEPDQPDEPDEPGTPGTPGQEVSVHTALGLPSAASTGKTNDYLSVKAQYVMAYSGARKNPNWVSWELNTSYLGSAPRQDNYRSDSTLPASLPQAKPADYSGSGWDRGHMCPSADRTKTETANGQTFYLSNMIPQATNNNGGPWAKLENYTRALAESGKQVYVVAGGVYASSPQTIGNGVAVPSDTWKVVVVLGGGQKGPSAVTTSTRVIAVSMPNRDSAVSTSDDWQRYRTSVDAIESATGLDLLADVGNATEAILEAKVDNQ